MSSTHKKGGDGPHAYHLDRVPDRAVCLAWRVLHESKMAASRGIGPVPELPLLADTALWLTTNAAAHYREFVQVERRKTNSQFGANRTLVLAMPNRVTTRMPCEAMSLSMVVWLG